MIDMNKFLVDGKDLGHYLNQEGTVFVDVRSPSEFNEARIPGAFNLPVLNDGERHQVGWTYVQKSHDLAKSLGVSYIAEHLEEIFNNIMDLTQSHDSVILYCSRGGMRSDSLYALLHSLNVPVKKLEGGYKAYRNYIRQALDKLIAEKNFIVLSGLTGVGKTELLHQLEEQGESILNLEKLANHRGSNLGHVGLGKQPSQKLFESYFYDALASSRDRVFVEAESTRIGKIHLPKSFNQALKTSPHLEVVDNIDNRVHRLVRDYAGYGKEELYSSLDKFIPYLGKEPVAHLKENLDQGEYKKVAEYLVLNHYDLHYKAPRQEASKKFSNQDPDQAAKNILAYLDKNMVTLK